MVRLSARLVGCAVAGDFVRRMVLKGSLARAFDGIVGGVTRAEF